MKLCRFLPDEPAGIADLSFCGRHEPASNLRIVFRNRHGRENSHASRLFQCNQHIDGPMLQDLEAADRHAKLPAILEVPDRQIVQRRHGADCFGADGGDGFVDDTGDGRTGFPGFAYDVSARHANAGQMYVGGAQAVLGRVPAAHNALRIAGYEEA